MMMVWDETASESEWTSSMKIIKQLDDGEFERFHTSITPRRKILGISRRVMWKVNFHSWAAMITMRLISLSYFSNTNMFAGSKRNNSMLHKSLFMTR